MADLFHERSKDWDSNDLVKQLSSAIGTAIVEHIPLHEHMRVLDFGAGTGLISSHVAPSVNKILAVDISAAMLEKLASKPHLQGKVEVLCQDITKIPIENKFDLIMSAMAMHHVEDTDKLIQSFADHLVSGGGIALADLDKEDGSFHPEDGMEGVYHLGFERNEFKAVLEKHGFVDIAFKTALTLNKNGKEYSIFLVSATKK